MIGLSVNMTRESDEFVQTFMVFILECKLTLAFI